MRSGSGLISYSKLTRNAVSSPRPTPVSGYSTSSRARSPQYVRRPSVKQCRAAAEDGHDAQVGKAVVTDDEPRIGDLDRVGYLRQAEEGSEEDLKHQAHGAAEHVRTCGCNYPQAAQ